MAPALQFAFLKRCNAMRPSSNRRTWHLHARSPLTFLLFGSGLRGLAEVRAPRPMAPISSLGRRISKPGFWTAVWGTRDCEAETHLVPALQPVFLKNRFLVPASWSQIKIAAPGDSSCEAHSCFLSSFFALRPAPQFELRITNPGRFSTQIPSSLPHFFNTPKKSNT